MTRKELIDNIKRKKSFLCVGLDTDIKEGAGAYCKRTGPHIYFQQSNHRCYCRLLCGIQAKSRFL